MADGSIVIDTELNSSGFERGLFDLTKKGKLGLAALTAAIAAAGAAAIKVGADFEAAMSKVGAISGATGEDMEHLTAKAKEMGEKTKFSATQAADAFSYMAMAGWKTEDMLSGIEGVMNLAAASGEDLAMVSDIVTDALTAFGLKAEDSGRFADVLAAASSNANTNVAMMGQTFKYAAPIAGALGYTIEDTAVAIGLMANAGIKADQAGTSLRSIMTRLSAPPKMAAAAMDELNLSITNADGTMKPFNNVLEELRQKFAGMSQEQQVANAKALAGQEAMSGLLAIVNASQADFDKLTKAVATSAGSAERMAEVMNDNLKGQIVLLGSALEGTGIKIYEKFEKPLKTAVKSAIDNVGELNKELGHGELSQSVDKIAEGTGNVVAALVKLGTQALPPVLNTIALLISHGKEIIMVYATVKAGMIAHNTVLAITNGLQALCAASATSQHLVLSVLTGKTKLATAAQIAWNAVMNANPIGLVVTAVAALAAGIGILALTQKKHKTETDLLTESLKEQSEAWEELKEAQVGRLDQNLSEIDHTNRLWKELQSLADETGHVAEKDRERAKYLSDEINTLLPDAVHWIDESTLAYGENADAIDRLIEKKRAQAILDAQEGTYKEAMANYQAKQTEQAKLSIAIKEQEIEVEKLRQQYEQDGRISSHDAWADKHNELIEMKKAYGENEGLLREYYQSISQYETLAVAISNENYDQMGEILANYGSNLKRSTTATISELQEQARIAEENARLLREKLDQHVEGVTEDIVRIAEEGAKSAERELQKAFEEAGKNIALGFGRGISQGQTIVNAAVSSMVKQALAMTNKASDSHSPSRLFEGKAGYYIPAGFAVGILRNLAPVGEAAKKMVSAATEAAQAAIGADSQTIEKLLEQTTKELGELMWEELDKAGERMVDASTDTLTKIGIMEAQKQLKRYQEMRQYGLEEIDMTYQAYLGLESAKIAEKEKALKELETAYQAEREAAKSDKKRKAIDERYEQEKASLQGELDLLNEFKTNYSAAYEEMISSYQNAYDTIMSKQEALETKLKAFGQLYETIKDANGKDTGKIKLADLQSDIDTITQYGNSLEALKKKGSVTQEFLDEVLAMSVDDGLKYMQLLLSQTDTDFEAYLTLWKEKQKKSKEIAQRYYKDQFDTLKRDFNDKIDKQMGLLPDKAKTIGLNSSKNLADGLKANSGLVFSAIDDFINKFTQMEAAANAAQRAANEAANAQGSYAAASSYSVTDNSRSLTQNVSFNSPIPPTPAENYRAIKQAGRELAY